MSFSRPRGTRDFVGERAVKKRGVEERIRKKFESFGYQEIITPTFEHLELITSKSGEEIVEHLYDFEDKGNRKYALRPELTAPVTRAYVNSLQKEPKPVKLYYIGNCFRYERPQSGRYREFWQAGVELMGTPTPEGEAEVLGIAYGVVEDLGLKDFSLQVGHIGVLRELLSSLGVREQGPVLTLIDKGERQELEKRLSQEGVGKEGIETLLKTLSLKGRREEVVEGVKGLLQEEKILKEMEKLEETLDFAKLLGVECEVNMGIARGLDYYTGMVFEIYANSLGAENQICGGGSYRLAELLGGEPTSTCGFAFGFDRLILALEKEGVELGGKKGKMSYVVPVSEEYMGKALRVASEIRKHQACEVELNHRKLGKALSHASKKGFRFAVIVGEEIEEDRVVVKDLETREQREVELGEL